MSETESPQPAARIDDEPARIDEERLARWWDALDVDEQAAASTWVGRRALPTAIAGHLLDLVPELAGTAVPDADEDGWVPISAALAERIRARVRWPRG